MCSRSSLSHLRFYARSWQVSGGPASAIVTGVDGLFDRLAVLWQSARCSIVFDPSNFVHGLESGILRALTLYNGCCAAESCRCSLDLLRGIDTAFFDIIDPTRLAQLVAQ